MNTEQKNQYRLTSKSGRVYHTEAINEDKARTSFQRKRDKYVDSYASIAQGTIENLGPKTPVLSKAAQKRMKDARQSLVNVLNRTLVNFKNDYLGSYTAWCEFRREQDVADAILRNEKDPTPNNEYYIKRAKEALELKNLNLHRDITDAMDGYNSKFERMVDKLMEANFESWRTEVKEVRNMGRDLEFLIINGETECHARVIFVNGAIKAPHYRFITTVRNQK